MTKLNLFLATFIMTIFAAVSAHGQSNDVYIEQVGDAFNMVVNQTGDSNNVGGIDNDFTLDGDNMDVNIDQTGDGNSIDGQMYDGADCSAMDGGNDSRACQVSVDGAWSAWGACSGNDGTEMRTCDQGMCERMIISAQELRHDHAHDIILSLIHI